MAKKKIDLEAESQVTAEGVEDNSLTLEHVLDLAPSAAVVKQLQATDDNGAKLTDLLYKYKNGELSKLRKKFKEVEDFVKKLEAYLLQELSAAEIEGVSGKVGRIEIKEKDVASVEDWDKFYGHIKRKDEFDLLNKAVNQKACKERWEQGKQVPGVGVFHKKTLSVTKA